MPTNDSSFRVYFMGKFNSKVENYYSMKIKQIVVNCASITNQINI